jgi:hypothetical protein
MTVPVTIKHEKRPRLALSIPTTCGPFQGRSRQGSYVGYQRKLIHRAVFWPFNLPRGSPHTLADKVPRGSFGVQPGAQATLNVNSGPRLRWYLAAGEPLSFLKSASVEAGSKNSRLVPINAIGSTNAIGRISRRKST